MPSLYYHLHQADLGLLEIFALTWGVEHLPGNAQEAARALETAMQDPAQVEAVLARLPDDAREALLALQTGEGKMPWADAVRRFGGFREMGPGKRSREKPHERPISPLEVLWYAGLVGRAFLPTPRGPVEFAYIPDELRTLLPHPPQEASPRQLLGHPAPADEAAFPLPVTDHVLDHFTTFLAARRAHRPCDDAPDRRFWRYAPRHLEALARALGVLSPEGEVVTAAAKAFLEADRGTALLRLFAAWRRSAFNDLKLMPGVTAEGTWENDPVQAREAVLGWLAALPGGNWWSLSGLIAAVQQCCPHFQRPAPGDYDSWYLRAESGEMLLGWEHWNEVDGALIRFIITGPLAWFGAVALAAPAKGAPPMVFRLTSWGRAMLAGQPPRGLDEEKEPLMLRSDGRIAASWRTPRVVRYHIARFADWEGADRSGYRFRLSAAALRRAEAQGIAAGQVVRLLKAHSRAVPPALVKAIRRWGEHGVEATVRPLTVLQVRDPEILRALRESRAARFLGAVLGPAAVAVPPEAVPHVAAALAEMGYFVEIE